MVIAAMGSSVASSVFAQSGGMHMVDMNSSSMYLMGLSSGTSMNPQAWPMPMFMRPAGTWNLMFMGQAFLVDTQQSAPRGGDKLYSTNWWMASAEHRLGRGSFMVELMVSLEPATITERRYPELFQTGETAFGAPIVDGQHPHNLIMGLGFHYAHPAGANGTYEIYYAPVGDPALGPVAYPHRASALELPQAPLGHHWEDSTHISYNVVTGALKYKMVCLEASGFHGGEPGENRWTISYGAIDSWASRLSIFPTKHWMAQVSVGRLTHPEAEQPGDVVRATASLHYTRPMFGSSWSSSLVWGRNHETATQRNVDAYTLESLLPVSRKNFLTGRAELVDKDELFSDDPELEESLARIAGSTFRIGAYTAGYTRDIGYFFNAVEAGIGANATAYSPPAAIKPYYGDRPWGVSVYLRFRLTPAKR